MAAAVVSEKILTDGILAARTGDRPGGFFHHHSGGVRRIGSAIERFPAGIFWSPSRGFIDPLDTACGKQAMNEATIHIFNHNAMATQFQVRIANEEKGYAAQAAQAAFALTDQLE